MSNNDTNDSYSKLLSEYRKNNGMSVEEIYRALRHRDQLIISFGEENKRRLKLEAAVLRIRDKIYRTRYDYQRISHDKTNSWEDRNDFRNKASGLTEALLIIDMFLERDGFKID